MSPGPDVEPSTYGRGLDPRLRALIDRVWMPSTDHAATVEVTLGRAPGGRVPVEEYAIIPHPSRPRFLVPLGSRRVAVASFRKYNAIKAPTTRAVRAGLGVTFGSGVGERLFRHRLVVSVDPRLPDRELSERLILRHLSEVLGRSTLAACMTVRRLNPNAKVTLQLFDPTGTPVGYAKLGSSEATRALVRTEAAALSALGGRLQAVIVPTLLASGTWHTTEFAIGSPLPEGLRRWTQEPADAPEVNLAVATSGDIVTRPLAGSAYARRLRRQLFSSGQSAGDVPHELCAWLDRLEASPQSLRFGRNHGDWMPYNLGQMDGRVAAWDWEHSSADAPIGFDLLHWYFQHAMDADGLTSAVVAVDRAAAQLQVLGVAPEARPLVASLYLLDMFVRRTLLAVGGGGWNPRWYPGLLKVAATRDR